MKIAICDDIPSQRDTLKEAIINCPTWRGNQLVIKCFACGNALLEAVKAGAQYSYIFLDIQMPESSGLEIYNKIDNDDTAIVFVSTHLERLPETHALRSPGFLAKPFSQDTFNRTIRSVIDQKSDTLFFTFKDGVRKRSLPCRDIYYFSVEDHYLFAYTVSEKVTIYGVSLKCVDDELAASGFFRCNRSNLVNLRHCDCRRNNRVVFKHSSVNARILISKRKLRMYDEQLLLSTWR